MDSHPFDPRYSKTLAPVLMPDVRIIADENIPRVQELFARFGVVETVAGRSMTRELISDADVLLVRSVTRIDEALLQGARVRFVGSATIGTDHVDRDYLSASGITFAHAPGSNADSVVEYVLAALLCLSARRGEPLRGKTAGIVGCGHIGGRLASRLPELGISLLLNDPPLARERPRAGTFTSLDELIEASDIVTLHVPYTTGGDHPTHHLMDRRRTTTLKPGAWLLNTSRGPVVDNQALKDVLAGDSDRIGALVLDVWENEPLPDPDFVGQADLATPHIAGYSVDGKLEGALMLYDRLASFLGAEQLRPRLEGLTDTRLPAPPDPFLPDADWLHSLAEQMYDIAADDRRMRQMLLLKESERAAFFESLRRDYPDRRIFSSFQLPGTMVPAARRRPAAGAMRVRLLPATGP